jgi:hypothetical protein
MPDVLASMVPGGARTHTPGAEAPWKWWFDVRVKTLTYLHVEVRIETPLYLEVRVT